MILIIDNYDSFVYNLYQMMGAIDPAIEVVRNDEVTVDDIARRAPSALVLSPGPGRPADAGVCEEACRVFAGRIPILGVCLGHQAICEALGGRVGYAKKLMHGKTSRIRPEAGSVLFRGMPDEFAVARYHSLAAVEDELPACLRVTARTADGEVMAIEHAEHPVFGVQFHPESVMTEHGAKILGNFIEVARSFEGEHAATTEN